MIVSFVIVSKYMLIFTNEFNQKFQFYTLLLCDQCWLLSKNLYVNSFFHCYWICLFSAITALSYIC